MLALLHARTPSAMCIHADALCALYFDRCVPAVRMNSLIVLAMPKC